MKLWKWIRRQLDKWPESPGLIRPGNWHVVYPDGQKTYRMTYDVCKSQRARFGGEIKHRDDEVE
jgi:hypothetical protein